MSAQSMTWTEPVLPAKNRSQLTPLLAADPAIIVETVGRSYVLGLGAESVSTQPQSLLSFAGINWGISRSYEKSRAASIGASSSQKWIFSTPNVLWVEAEAESQPTETQVPIVRSKDRAAEGRFRFLLERGGRELFEDGMDSDFTADLESIVRSYGPDSKEILSRLLEDARTPSTAWAEAMRWIGKAEVLNPCSRLSLLEQGLASPSAEVRDGATLGLASMNDPSGIQPLERAVALENVDELRSDMEQVLAQLRSR